MTKSRSPHAALSTNQAKTAIKTMQNQDAGDRPMAPDSTKPGGRGDKSRI